MGCFGSKEAVVKEKAGDAKETIEEIAHETKENLTTPAPAGGGVNLQYDATKSPEENAAQPPPPDENPMLHPKILNAVQQKYPDGSVTMGDPPFEEGK